MTENEERYLITFKISSMAFKFENYCKKQNIEVKMVPVPSKLSKSCGYACRIKQEDLEDIKVLCEEKNIKYSEFYKMDEGDKPHKL